MQIRELAEPAHVGGILPARVESQSNTPAKDANDIDSAHLITLTRPLPGFRALKRFALLALSNQDYGPFKLFQAIDQPGTSFIVLPINKDCQAFAPGDLDQAFSDSGLDRRVTEVMLIVTCRKDPNGHRIFTVNLRAPILVDTRQHIACQHIFMSSAYAIQQPLDLMAASQG